MLRLYSGWDIRYGLLYQVSTGNIGNGTACVEFASIELFYYNPHTEMKPFYHTVIERHSDYTAHDPYWINLYWYFGDEHKELSKAISDALNVFFRKHGPDANEDFASTCSCSMQRETVDKALAFAIKKCRKLIPEEMRSDLPHKLIDGGWSQETDCRENDPVTGELLHSIPICKPFVLDELQCLVEQDKISKGDWVWCDFVVNSFGYNNSDINAMLNRIARKFR